MSWFEAIVLGIVQGLTEFLPISSSAHLLILSQLFGWEDPGAAFTAVTQIGTETAVIIYFRREIAAILKAWSRSIVDADARHDPDARMGWLVIIGTIPIAVLGLLFQDQIETVARNLWLTATMLIVFGLILGVADALGARVKTERELTVRDGILFGLAQSLALIPGVSRSGASISAGLAMGYTRAAAARYAFLLAVPAVLASGLYEATKIGDDANVSWGPTILATLIAFGVGFAVIAWLMRWLTTKSYLPFVIYRLVLGVLCSWCCSRPGCSRPEPRGAGAQSQPDRLKARNSRMQVTGHHAEDGRVAPGLLQLGHGVEVHPVDGRDRRGHGRDRHPRRDLAHVLVLLEVLQRRRGHEHGHEQVVRGVDGVARPQDVLADVPEVGRQAGWDPRVPTADRVMRPGRRGARPLAGSRRSRA